MIQISTPARHLIAAALALPALAFPAAASAQESAGQGRIVSIGAGLQLKPEYPGADSLRLGPLPFFDIRKEGDPLTFEAPDEGIGFGLLGSDESLSVGPAVNLVGKRRERDVGAPVGNVGFTFELGAFAQAHISDNVRLRVEGRKGLGGHEGWVGDIAADFVIRDRDNYVFSIGPRARWADGKYHDSYFGVSAPVASVTGLAPFDPGSGFHSVGVASGITHMVGRNVGVYAYAGYDRLIGDAADSPIVRTFGSRDQFSGGLALFYTFNAGKLFGG